MRIALLAMSLSLLTACGNKGPLYLPGEAAPQTAATAHAPQPDKSQTEEQEPRK